MIEVSGEKLWGYGIAVVLGSLVASYEFQSGVFCQERPEDGLGDTKRKRQYGDKVVVLGYWREKCVFHSFRKCNGRINLVISVTLGNQIFFLDELRVSLIMI